MIDFNNLSIMTEKYIPDSFKFQNPLANKPIEKPFKEMNYHHYHHHEEQDYESNEENKDYNKHRALFWASMLKNEKYSNKLIATNEEILNIKLDTTNQRVIKNDCNRTRTGIFDENLKDNLETILTFYCKREMIGYKQGLNEVAAVFVNFKKSEVMLANIYNYFVLFMEKFLPNAYTDKDFLGLQCSLRAFSMILKYHDPNFYNFLNANDVPAEIYAMPWFLTLFASKLTFEALYLFWDIYILENDEYFIFFICVALLLENKTQIMQADMSMVPMLLTSLKFETPSEIKNIYLRAKQIKASTPDSFILKIKELRIYRRDYVLNNHSQLTMQKNMQYLEKLPCLMISPWDLVHNLYPQALTCSNKKCKSIRGKFLNLGNIINPTDSSYFSDSEFEISKSKLDLDISETPTTKQITLPSNIIYDRKLKQKSNDNTCRFCCGNKRSLNDNQMNKHNLPHIKHIINKSKNIKHIVDYIIIDLRETKEYGILPKSHLVDTQNMTDDTILKLIDDMIELKHKYHFSFLISNYQSMDCIFHQKQNNYYINADDNNDLPPFLKFNNDMQLFNKREEKILHSFVNHFIQNGFPYISIIEGGFIECHNLIMNLKQELINHNIITCKLCVQNSQENKTSPNMFTRLFNKVIGENIKTGLNNKNPNIIECSNRKPPLKSLKSTQSINLNPKLGSSSPVLKTKDLGNRIRNNNNNNITINNMPEQQIALINPLNSFNENIYVNNNLDIGSPTTIYKPLKFITNNMIKSNLNSPIQTQFKINKDIASNDQNELLYDTPILRYSREKSSSKNAFSLNLDHKYKGEKINMDNYVEGEENVESSRIQSYIINSPEIIDSQNMPYYDYNQRKDTELKNNLDKDSSLTLPSNVIENNINKSEQGYGSGQGNGQKDKVLQINHSPKKMDKTNNFNASRYVFNIQKNGNNQSNYGCTIISNDRAKTEINQEDSQSYLDERRSVGMALSSKLTENSDIIRFGDDTEINNKLGASSENQTYISSSAICVDFGSNDDNNLNTLAIKNDKSLLDKSLNGIKIPYQMTPLNNTNILSANGISICEKKNNTLDEGIGQFQFKSPNNLRKTPVNFINLYDDLKSKVQTSDKKALMNGGGGAYLKHNFQLGDLNTFDSLIPKFTPTNSNTQKIIFSNDITTPNRIPPSISSSGCRTARIFSPNEKDIKLTINNSLSKPPLTNSLNLNHNIIQQGPNNNNISSSSFAHSITMPYKSKLNHAFVDRSSFTDEENNRGIEAITKKYPNVDLKESIIIKDKKAICNQLKEDFYSNMNNPGNDGTIITTNTTTQPQSFIPPSSNNLGLRNNNALKQPIYSLSTTFQKSNTQNDNIINGVISKNLQSTKEYYLKNGILQPIKLKGDEIKSFYKLLNGPKFSYFITDYVKNIKYKDGSTANKIDLSPANLSRRILILTQEFLIVISYEEIISNNLHLIQKGMDIDKLMNVIQEPHKNAKYANTNNAHDKNMIGNFMPNSSSNIIIPEEHINDNKYVNYPNESINNNNNNNNNLQTVIIKSIFPLKLLLRIVTKKSQLNQLLFYFKLPNIEGNFGMDYYKLLNLMGYNALDHLIKYKDNIEFLNILKKIRDIQTDHNMESIESKGIYIMKNDKIAQDCIDKAREYFNQACQTINYKLTNYAKNL